MTHHILAEVKERVVQQHIAGLGRNIISKRTGLSRGSVTNILKAWRELDNSGIPSQPGKILDLDRLVKESKILDLDRLVKEWNYGYSVDMNPAQGNNNGGSGSSIKGGDSGKGSNNGGSGGLKVSDFKLDTELHIH